MQTIFHAILIVSAGLTGLLSAQLLASIQYGTDKPRPWHLLAALATWITMACFIT